jgi:hypothetical protein
MEYVLRFLIGGAIVSLFAVFGDVLRPKSATGIVRSSSFRRARNAWPRLLGSMEPVMSLLKASQ